MFKVHLRRIWEEDVPFDNTRKDDEKNSIEKYCENSGYKYFSHFVSGNNYEFKNMKTYINEGNAVSFEIYYFMHSYKGIAHSMDK